MHCTRKCWYTVHVYVPRFDSKLLFQVRSLDQQESKAGEVFNAHGLEARIVFMSARMTLVSIKSHFNPVDTFQLFQRLIAGCARLITFWSSFLIYFSRSVLRLLWPEIRSKSTVSISVCCQLLSAAFWLLYLWVAGVFWVLELAWTV